MKKLTDYFKNCQIEYILLLLAVLLFLCLFLGMVIGFIQIVKMI